MASGHDDGSLFTWELRSSAAPARHVPSSLPEELSWKPGHVRGARIKQLGFIGSRHSSFVSADIRGMVFHHNAHRRKIFSSLETTRLLGRYPTLSKAEALKPSTTYTSAILPLGSVPHFTDSLGLVAILTPYKLVVVSTMPVPRTHFSLQRPTGLIADCTVISGCAAWYPSVHTTIDDKLDSSGTHPRLAYVWSKQLYILTVEKFIGIGEPDAIVRTTINIVREYRCAESIVDIQWSNNEILCLMTVSNQLLFLDVDNLHVINQCDLIEKHILHHDIFTGQLGSYFEQREAEYVNQEFADSYSASFQMYKGRIFLLGVQDISIGTLNTWADRVIALISQGRQIEAINLLQQYYKGSTELRGLNLPVTDQKRQAKLVPKIYETILASIKYSLASEDLSIRSDIYHTSLLTACFESCLLLSDLDFLFNKIFELYNEEGRTEPFLKLLASYVLGGDIIVVPPSIVQQIVHYFLTQNMHTRLEDTLCHLDARGFDIDRIIQLCKEHNLHNALSYVMTEALLDYVGPMVEFIQLIQSVMLATCTSSSTDSGFNQSKNTQFLGRNTVNAVKVYPYISMTLTGRIFPVARCRENHEEVERSKAGLYDFLFSGYNVPWPAGSAQWVTTGLEDNTTTFPYLRLLLLFDCPTFLACLEDVFEDSFLNDDTLDTLSKTRVPLRNTTTRQFIINILIEVMATGFSNEDILYLYMFIARTVPKYPQFILLSGSLLQKIIVSLCKNDDPELVEDCQLSVEYLLSVYRPSQSAFMLACYRQAGFHRVLKGTLRSEGLWDELLMAYLNDRGSEHDIFPFINEILGLSSALPKTAKDKLKRTVLQNIVPICDIDGARAAQLVDQYLPEMKQSVYVALKVRDSILYVYLRQLIHCSTDEAWLTPEIRETYIKLLQSFDQDDILDYIKTLQIDDVDVDRVIANLEKHDAANDCDQIEAIVHLMSLQDRPRQALQRIIQVLERLANSKRNSTRHAAAPFMAAERCAALGIRLCRMESSRIVSQLSTEPGVVERSASFLPLQMMWVSLLTGITRFAVTVLNGPSGDFVTEHHHPPKDSRISVRNIILHVFRSLFDTTTNADPTSLVPILRNFFEVLSSERLEFTTIHVMLKEVFDSHQYYHQLLSLAEAIYASDMFAQLSMKYSAHNTGWKVKRPFCTICNQRVYDTRLLGLPFREHQVHSQQQRAERQMMRLAGVERIHGLPLRDPAGKKKGQEYYDQTRSAVIDSSLRKSAIIAHACGHLTHESCFQDKRSYERDDDVHCFVCQSGPQLNQESAGAWT